MSKSVNIPQELFVLLYKYFNLPDCQTEQAAAQIRTLLNDKMDAMARRELYTTYKTADSEADREAARREYLSRIGMPDSFIY